ncbi:MAG: hypothetical protein ACR2ND_14295 [Solirubrobacteraceae bacterium]
MFNRKLIVVPASLAVLAFGAAGASADTFLLGSTNSSTNQGINNNQSASQSNLGAGGSGTTIVNRSGYSPSVNQGATNANVNAPAAAPTGTGDTFNTGNSNTSTNQGINNNQSADQDLAGGGSGTTIVNRSGFTPSINQGVTNANVNATSAGTASTGDVFLLGGNNTSTGQAINSTQAADQSGAGVSGGTLIINNSGFTPSANQGTCNVNANADGGTSLLVLGLACGGKNNL